MPRWLTVMCLLMGLFVAAGTAGPDVRADDEPGPLNFRWAFVGYSPGDAGGELVRIDRDIKLQSGDRFKFFFEMQPGSYAYLVTYGSQGELQLLFPSSPGRYDTPSPPVGRIYIPSGGNWFQLDDQKGQERFYLLVSAQRLLELESLLKAHRAAVGARKETLKESVLNEIRHLRWKYRKFKKPAERPVAVMGQTRGVTKTALPDAQSVSELAIPIEAATFFSRTFTIDHH